MEPPQYNPNTAASIPQRFGSYSVLEACGTGGMGMVYKGLHDGTGQRVAIKVIRRLDPDGEELRRFQREAEVIQRLDHPAIVKLLSYGREGDQDYLAMEFIDGLDLKEWHEVEQPKPEALLAIIAEIADAIDYAHREGVIHRDIKPSNILIRDDDHPCIADFGLARQIGIESSLTASEMAVGTPGYMAPEQATGDHVHCGPGTDIWALGVILYRFCTGRPPFEGGTPYQVISSVVNDDPIRPRSLNPDLPRHVETIILNCLVKRIDQRYRSAAVLAADIRRYLAGGSVRSLNRGLPAKLRKRLVLGMAMVLTVTIAMAAIANRFATSGAESRSEWLQVWQWDGQGDPADSGILPTQNSQYLLQLPSERLPHGWVPERYRWHWVDGIRVPGDVRVEVDIYADEDPNSIEIAINAKREPIRDWTTVPTGYSAQAGSFFGTIDFISRNATAATADLVHTKPGEIHANQRYTITFERIGDTLSLQTNDLPPLVRSFPVPIASDGLESIGFRSYARDLAITGMRIYRRATTDADPLLAGDIALRFGAVEQAIAEYDALARISSDREQTSRALGRAYLIARSEPELGDVASEFRQRLDAAYRNTQAYRVVAMVEAAELTAEGDPAALDAIDACLAMDADSPVMAYVIERITDRRLLSDHQILTRIASSRDIKAVMLNRGSDLSLFADSQLFWLHCNGSSLKSITPLAGHQLQLLFLGSSEVTDLGPLHGMPLRCLYLDGTPIANLDPLSSLAKLRWLSVRWSQLSDLAPLHGLDLYHLDLAHSKVHDLSPLTGMPLVELNIRGLQVDNLSPLQDAPLQILDMSYSRTKPDRETIQSWKLQQLHITAADWPDLKLLENIPLKLLRANRNEISDISNIAQPALRHLAIAANRVTDLRPLVGIPMQHLACQVNPLSAQGLEGFAPPLEFLFGDGIDIRMAPAALERLITILDQSGDHPLEAASARALARYYQDPAGLLNLAQTIEGGHMLHLPLWCKSNELEEVLASIGAELLPLRMAEKIPHDTFQRGLIAWTIHNGKAHAFSTMSLQAEGRPTYNSLLLYWPEED